MNIYNLHEDPNKLIAYSEQNAVLFPVLAKIDDVADEEIYEGKIRDAILDNNLKGDPAVERAILALGKAGTYLMYLYATDIIKRRWPEAEEIIKLDDWLWDDYLATFKR